MSLATEAPSDTSTRVKNAVAAALDKKAENIRVLCLRPVSDFADYFLICTGSNDRQVQAIADAVQDSLRAEGVRPLHVEGERVGAWVLVDYGDLVVHVFQPEPRGFYGLERLWSDAPDETARFVA